MEMRGQRDAGSNQDRDRGECAPTEAARDRAQAVAVIVGAKRGNDRRYQEELPADEERHREQVQVADERHSCSCSASAPANAVPRRSSSSTGTASSIIGKSTRSSKRMWLSRRSPSSRSSAG